MHRLRTNTTAFYRYLVDKKTQRRHSDPGKIPSTSDTQPSRRTNEVLRNICPPKSEQHKRSASAMHRLGKKNLTFYRYLKAKQRSSASSYCRRDDMAATALVKMKHEHEPSSPKIEPGLDLPLAPALPLPPLERASRSAVSAS